jgi:hypothetical protein
MLAKANNTGSAVLMHHHDSGELVVGWRVRVQGGDGLLLLLRAMEEC